MKLLAVGVEPVGLVAIGAAPSGIVAIGQFATGFLAIGQLSRGVIAVGQLAVGVVVVGQVAAGLVWASGQLALAPLAGWAQLPISPFGRFHPLRLKAGKPDWLRLRTPKSTVGWITGVVVLLAIAACVALFVVVPLWDVIVGEGGVFRAVTPILG